MTTFDDILSRKASSIEKPKPLPLGYYVGVVQGMPKQREFTGKDGTEYKTVDYMFKLVSIRQLDNSDSIAPDLTTLPPLKKTFFLDSESAQYGHQKFLVNVLGIEQGDKTVGELMSEAPGKQALVKLKHRPYTDQATGEPGIASEIDTVAKV